MYTLPKKGGQHTEVAKKFIEKAFIETKAKAAENEKPGPIT